MKPQRDCPKPVYYTESITNDNFMKLGLSKKEREKDLELS